MKHSITLAGTRTRGAESLAVKAGGLVFTGALSAGMRGGPMSSVAEEAESVLALAQDILDALGSDLSEIAKLKGYLTDIRHAGAFRDALSDLPAAISMVGAMLASPDERLAIELIAGAGLIPKPVPVQGNLPATAIGPLIFTAGSKPNDQTGDLRRQAGQVLDAIVDALRSGGADKTAFVKINNTAARWHNYSFYNELYNDRLTGVNAARCSVGGALEDPLALIEVEAVAARGVPLRFVDSTHSGVGRTSFIHRDDTVYLPTLGPCKGPHSHGARAGDFVFIAGECPYDEQDRLVGPGDIAAQTEQTMRNVQISLEALGASFDDVVRTNVTLSDMRLFDGFDAAYARSFKAPYPARSVVGAPLGQYGLLVEIEAIAVIGAARDAVVLVSADE